MWKLLHSKPIKITRVCGMSSTKARQLRDQLLYEALLPQFGQSTKVITNRNFHLISSNPKIHHTFKVRLPHISYSWCHHKQVHQPNFSNVKTLHKPNPSTKFWQSDMPSYPPLILQVTSIFLWCLKNYSYSLQLYIGFRQGS